MSAHWSLGVLIGLPIGVLCLAGLVVGGVLIIRAANPRDYDYLFFKWLGRAMLAAAGAVALVLASPAGLYPYKAEYHQWRPVSGQVEQINSRIISDGNKSVNQRFVVKIAGSEKLYGCDDTRCSTLKPGDTVHLSCKREWQYASVSGYGCRWAS